MKKFLSVFLIFAMMLTVCACGDSTSSSSDDDKASSSAPSSSEADTQNDFTAGKEFDVPENIYNGDTLNASFKLTEDGATTNMEIGLDVTSDDMMIIYIKNDDVELVLETDEYSAVSAAYSKAAGSTEFVAVDDVSSVEEMAFYGLIYGSLFGPAFSEAIEGSSFVTKEIADGCNGAATVYTIMFDGEEDGELWVDNATGMVVKYVSTSDGVELEAISVSKAALIPSYK